jgi:hypothetical protein
MGEEHLQPLLSPRLSVRTNNSSIAGRSEGKKDNLLDHRRYCHALRIACKLCLWERIFKALRDSLH